MSNKSESKNGLSKKQIAIASICGGVLLLLFVVFIVLDLTAGRQLYMENATDLKIEQLSVFFEDEEENLVDYIFEGSLDAGEKVKYDYAEPIESQGYEYECIIRFTFEDGHEFDVMDGSFYRDFAGNIRLKFYKKGDNYYLKTKAGVGLFENTRSTDMDTDIILYFDGEDEGDWDYVMPDGDDEDD